MTVAALHRTQVPVQARFADQIQVADKSVINFSSNDYLALSTDPAIKESWVKGIEQFGMGSGASVCVSGYTKAQQKFEEACSDYLKRDKTILFGSGYLANLGILSSLLSRHSTVVSDKQCHASIIDGIQLSRAKHLRYRHQDIKHCQQLCEENNPDVLVTERVFSMTGEITPISRLAKGLSSETIFVVDDAHGFSVLNETLYQSEVPVTVIPLGKAIGAYGAIVSGKAEIIEQIQQRARSYRYTTNIPPANVFALSSAMRTIQEESWRRQHLLENIRYFNACAKDLGLDLLSQDETPIRCLLIGDNQRAMTLQKDCMVHGWFVAAIRPPTVATGCALLRISLRCDHQKSDMLALLRYLEKKQ